MLGFPRITTLATKKAPSGRDIAGGSLTTAVAAAIISSQQDI